MKNDTDLPALLTRIVNEYPQLTHLLEIYHGRVDVSHTCSQCGETLTHHPEDTATIEPSGHYPICTFSFSCVNDTCDVDHVFITVTPRQPNFLPAGPAQLALSKVCRYDINYDKQMNK